MAHIGSGQKRLRAGLGPDGRRDGGQRDGEQLDGGLRVDELVVEYVRNGYAIRPLDGLNLVASPGELVVLLGPSGTGKTTLLSCLGGILTPKSGTISVGDTVVTALAGRALTAYRRDQVGFVFQGFNLVASLSARENVAMPLLMAGSGKREAMRRADELLERVGLSERAHHRPAQLSGGQQQRVAVARGLVRDPRLLLADEPTANLDYVQAESVIALLRELRDDGRVIVVSSHDSRLVPIADTLHEMAPGPNASAPEEPPIEQRVTAGTSIFEQGDRAEHVYRISDGEVDVVRVLADGTEEVLARLGKGQYFGELGPLLGFPRSASARAHTDVTLTRYGIRAFRREVRSEP